MNKDNNTSTGQIIYGFQTGVRNLLGKTAGYLIGIFGVLTAFFVSLLTNPSGDIGLKEKFYDPWFWIIWAVIFVLVIIVWISNYRITKAEAKKTPEYLSTMEYYAKAKQDAMPYLDVINEFCYDKNTEIHTMIEREIVESADLIYSKWKAGEYQELDKYQIKILKKVRKIKIRKIRGRDLTQETEAGFFNRTYSFLPRSEKTAERLEIISNAGSRAINTFVFMLVGSLTFSMVGWVSAIINSFAVMSSWIGATTSAYEYVNNTLRIRFIAKADLLIEFVNVVYRYAKEPKAIEIEPISDLDDKNDIILIEETKEPKKEDLDNVNN